MTITDATCYEDLRRVATMVRAICALPAVPTQDWCDRAGEIVGGIRPGAVTCVYIASIDPDGRVLRMECRGGTIRPEPLSLRTGASLPWWPELSPAGSCEARTARIAQSDSEGETPGRPAPRLELQDSRAALVGVIPLQPRDPLRVLVVELWVSEEPWVLSDSDEACLAAVLPELARQALLAFGERTVDEAGFLTAREQHVLELLSSGHTIKEIATQLSRSPHTIHDHVKSLHRKLKASCRGELVARALGHIESGNGRAP